MLVLPVEDTLDPGLGALWLNNVRRSGYSAFNAIGHLLGTDLKKNLRGLISSNGGCCIYASGPLLGWLWVMVSP